QALRYGMAPATARSRGILATLSVSVDRRQRSQIRAADSAQLMGRREPGAHGAAHPALDGALPQIFRVHAVNDAMGARHRTLGRVPPADGSGDGRLQSRPGRLFTHHADTLRFHVAPLWSPARRLGD